MNCFKKTFFKENFNNVSYIKNFQSKYLTHKFNLALTLFSKATLKVSGVSSFDIVILLYKKKSNNWYYNIIDQVKLLPIILPYLQCFPQDVFNSRFKMDINGLRYRV